MNEAKSDAVHDVSFGEKKKPQMVIPGSWVCRPGVDWLYKHIAWAETLTIHHSII